MSFEPKNMTRIKRKVRWEPIGHCATLWCKKKKGTLWNNGATSTDTFWLLLYLKWERDNPLGHASRWTTRIGQKIQSSLGAFHETQSDGTDPRLRYRRVCHHVSAATCGGRNHLPVGGNDQIMTLRLLSTNYIVFSLFVLYIIFLILFCLGPQKQPSEKWLSTKSPRSEW